MVKQERALRTRRALIHAGAQAFADEGFTAASLTAISRAAGVSNGALHFHFENKMVLARAVEEEALAALRHVAQEALEGEDAALSALVRATHGLVGRIADDVVVRAGFGLCDDLGRHEGVCPRREWQRWVEEAVRRAERDGSLSAGVAASAAAAAVVAATVGLEVLGSHDRTWWSKERVTGFWELLLPRLTARHASIDAAGGG